MDAEVVVIGAGMAGMATAARLQARGISTMVLEAHGQVGGCAGFFQTQGFSFDVGATTFVDFGPDGVGGAFLAELGLARIEGEALPGYRAWLPDRTVTLHRESDAWHRERLAAFGASPAHQRFWSLLDELADAFWTASRAGVKLPLTSPRDLLAAARCLPLRHWPLTRYLGWTMQDAMQACGVAEDRALRGLLAMLLQDTVHSPVETAPLINGALGITIRGAGLTRPRGGARGFWKMMLGRYRALGGVVRVGTCVEQLSRQGEGFMLHTRRGAFQARQVVSTLPIWNSARLGLPEVERALAPYMARDESALGSALVLFLGVPEQEVCEQPLTHHQILLDYERPLNNGNNMFISVSAPGDTESAPAGWRSVMISTHCELTEWEGLSTEQYEERKAVTTQALLAHARRVYPSLGHAAKIVRLGTPRTYARYTHRYRGAVGGIRLTLNNSNQFAVAHDLGVPGFWQAGDTTWPGLGTVACVLGSLHVADALCATRSRAGQSWSQRVQTLVPTPRTDENKKEPL
ncbi:MAG: FAD-dependent oxidoreductase [Ardenticatenales bacterium]|nr:FAD-dependent oxidoreductase [Ardenticatenales bacterium]